MAKEITPEERLKILRKREEERQKEIALLEEKLKKEKEEIDSEIKKTIEDMRRDEEEKFKEEQLNKLKKKEGLENQLDLEEVNSKPRETPLEYMSKPPENLYEIANHDFYEHVKDLTKKASDGYISQNERNFLSKLGNKLTEIQEQDSYLRHKDPDEYITRTRELLNKFSTNF